MRTYTLTGYAVAFADKESRDIAKLALSPYVERPSAFVITGNAPGTGKSYLAKRIIAAACRSHPDEVRAFACGSASAMSWVPLYDAACMGYLFLDNIHRRVLKSPELNRFLTASEIQTRIPRTCELATIANTTITVITGNCIEIDQDLQRRVKVINLWRDWHGSRR